jgi:hypothetical protein
MVMYLWHLRPPPRIWRTRPELKKTSVEPPSVGDGVDLCSRRHRRRDWYGGCCVGRWPKRGGVTLLAREMLPPISLSPALLRWSSACTLFPLFAPLAPAPGETADLRVSSGPGPEVLYAPCQPQRSPQPALASRGPVWTACRLPNAPYVFQSEVYYSENGSIQCGCIYCW